LSVLEETELEYVLMRSELDSPLLHETRALMGISRSVNLQAKKKRLFVAWGWRAAACVAILIGCAVLLRNHITTETNTIANKEGVELSVNTTKDIAKSEATKKEPQESKVKTEERAEIEATQAVSQSRPATLSQKKGKRKTRKVRQEPSDMTTSQAEQPIIAETSTPATEPTMPSTHIAPEHVVYIINGERQMPTPDMPSINDLRMRGQRLTAEVMQQIQKPIEF
jgi:cytoskeletal protein RodZ